MGATVQVKKLFLRFLAGIYMFAFMSIYLQIRGLYGENGVLPAHTQLNFESGRSFAKNLWQQPTLLYLAPHLGLNVQYSMELISLIGLVLAVMGVVTQKMCSTIVFVLMWAIYLSLFQVGQTFLNYQWDLLLLEVGFVSILLTPICPWFSDPKSSHITDPLVFIQLRWILFRILVSATVLKLVNKSPAWWSLTALSAYYQGQALPTHMAWYSFHMPEWYNKTCVVITIVIEMLLPVFFLLPLRQPRHIAYLSQFLLQLMIFVHGNYNWFNLLIIALTLALVDDRFLFSNQPQPTSFMTRVFHRALYSTLGFVIFQMFSPRFGGNQLIDWKISFSPDQFNQALKVAIPACIALAAVSLVGQSVSLFYSVVVHSKTFKKFLSDAVQLTAYSLIVFFLFGSSVVHFSSLDRGTQASLPSFLNGWNEKFNQFHLTSTYGWFRPIDHSGRPDLILEGAANAGGPWIEIPFQYKPCDVERLPPFIAPHQPRLDWQMWMAATDDYKHNPWLASLVYRLLTNESRVVDLLDVPAIEERFKETTWPPKYIRGSVYVYQFTPASSDPVKSTDWWRRRKTSDYMPVLTADHKPLVDYLTKLKLLGHPDRLPVTNQPLKSVLDTVSHFLATTFQPHVTIWALLAQAATAICCL